MVDNCIFCKCKLTAINRTIEHILLNCLGGRVSTSVVICHPCNTKFGDTIDKEFCRQVAPVRTIGGFSSGTGKPPPRYTFDRKGAVMLGDGTVKIKPTIREKIDGRTLHLKAEGEPEKVEEIVTAILRSKGFAESKIESVFAEQEFVLRNVNERMQFSFNGPEMLPSMFKQSLVLIGRVCGNRIVAGSMFDDAREIINDGIKTAHGSNWWRDSRPINDAAYFEKFGAFFNIIRISSNEEGQVKGYFRLYNQIAYIFVLAENGGPKNIDFFLVNDPSDTSNFELNCDTCFNADFYAWLSQPQFNIDEFKESFKNLYKRFRARQYRHEIGHRVSNVVSIAAKKEVTISGLTQLIMEEFTADIVNASEQRNRVHMREILKEFDEE